MLGNIERVTGLSSAPIKEQEYLADMGAAIGRVLRRGIILEPFLEERGGANPLLRFRISNTGRRDVELLEIEAAVPRVIVNPPNWGPGAYPGLAVGLLLSYAVAAMPDPSMSRPYYLEIMLPGSLVGLIVGYATQRQPRAAAAQ